MTVPAKTPTRRTLATRVTHIEAVVSAAAWAHDLGDDADVRVEPNIGYERDTRPWAITAKRTAGGGS